MSVSDNTSCKPKVGAMSVCFGHMVLTSTVVAVPIRMPPIMLLSSVGSNVSKEFPYSSSIPYVVHFAK